MVTVRTIEALLLSETVLVEFIPWYGSLSRVFARIALNDTVHV
jgi:hypothetical protein